MLILIDMSEANTLYCIYDELSLIIQRAYIFLYRGGAQAVEVLTDMPGRQCLHEV